MNGKGCISKGDLRQIFGKDADEGVISKMIEEATRRTNEQRISYDEFLHLMLEEPDGLKTTTKVS
jgi:Ca2+-binding EF-hand superfamily protein